MGLFNKLKRAFLGEEEVKEKEVKDDIKSDDVNEDNASDQVENNDEQPLDDEQTEHENNDHSEQESSSDEETVVSISNEEISVDTMDNDAKEMTEDIVDEDMKSELSDVLEEHVESLEEHVVENTTEEEEPAIDSHDSINEEDCSSQEEEEVVSSTEEQEKENSQDDDLVVDEKYDQGLEKTRKTFGERLNELFAKFRHVDEDFFEELEDTLITSDVGFETAMQLSDELRQEVKLKNAKKPKDLQNVIIQKLVDIYEQSGDSKDEVLHFDHDGLTVFLFVGVNGAGKTTTVGKLAHQLKNEGHHVLLAAADTFRAGAIDQLVEWGKRADVDVVRGKEGGDPASVVYDAIVKAKEDKADVLLVDTAGRLQNKVNLMNELAKIKRVIQRELSDAPQEVLLVLDGTTGQNALSQAKQFNDTTDVTGLVLTKLDGTAKGGIVLAIRNELNIPVKLVGLGEKIDDLAPFDAEQFAYGLFKGLWRE